MRRSPRRPPRQERRWLRRRRAAGPLSAERMTRRWAACSSAPSTSATAPGGGSTVEARSWLSSRSSLRYLASSAWQRRHSPTCSTTTSPAAEAPSRIDGSARATSAQETSARWLDLGARSLEAAPRAPCQTAAACLVASSDGVLRRRWPRPSARRRREPGRRRRRRPVPACSSGPGRCTAVPS